MPRALEGILSHTMTSFDAKIEANYNGNRRFAFAEIFNGIDPEIVDFLSGRSRNCYTVDHRRNAVGNIFENLTANDLDNLPSAIESLNLTNLHEKGIFETLLKRKDSWTDRYVRVEGSILTDDPSAVLLNKRRSGNPYIFDGTNEKVIRHLQETIPQILKRCNSWRERYSCRSGHFNCYNDSCELHLNKRRSGITGFVPTTSLTNEENPTTSRSISEKFLRRNSFPVLSTKDYFDQNGHKLGLRFKDVDSELSQTFNIRTGNQRKMSLSAVLEWESLDPIVMSRNTDTDKRDVHTGQTKRGAFNSMGERVSKLQHVDKRISLSRNDSWVNRYQELSDDGIHLNKRRSGKADIFLIPRLRLGSNENEVKLEDKADENDKTDVGEVTETFANPVSAMFVRRNSERGLATNHSCDYVPIERQNSCPSRDGSHPGLQRSLSAGQI